MNCEDARSLLGPFIDEELSVEVVALLNRHIHDCLDCEKERAALAAVRTRLHDLKPQLDPPEGFVDRLKESVETRQRAANRQDGLRKWQYVVPLAAAVAAVVLWLTPHSLEEQHLAPSAGSEKGIALTAPQLYSYEHKMQQSLMKAQEYDPNMAPQLVGFSSQPPAFHGWQLTKTCVVSVNSAKAIKYSYSQIKQGKVITMSCYQFRGGAFDASDLSHHVIDGRNICCGTHESVSLVYWRDAKKDFVLASQMPRADLLDIALQS
jgi:anti-sigma factor RsiW